MLVEARCGNCNKLLAKGGYEILEIKCPRCKTINQLERPRVPESLGENTREGVSTKQDKAGQF